MPVGSEMIKAIATEVSERKMCPCKAGSISSLKLFEIQAQSKIFGPRSWRARLLGTLLPGLCLKRKVFDLLYRDGPAYAVPVRDDQATLDAGPDHL